MKKYTIRCFFCSDRIDIITNFAVITNAVIKRGSLYVTARAKHKRPPLVGGNHCSPASRAASLSVAAMY